MNATVTNPQIYNEVWFMDVPRELRQKPNWVLWQLEDVNGRSTKIPYQVNGQKASSTDPSTWSTFDKVVDTPLSAFQGVGVVTDGSFIGFDLDGCRNPQTGEIKQWAQRIVDTLGTYTEVTPSGYGVRVYALGQLPDGPRRFSVAVSAGFGEKVGIEVYETQRYFAVTGNRLGQASGLQSANVLAAYEQCRKISREFPSEKRQHIKSDNADDGGSVQIERAPGRLIGATKLDLLMYGKIVSEKPSFVVQDEYGNKITYPSHSEADMALAILLAMKHGDQSELIDADFRESCLYRPKWDRLAESTIKKAIEKARQLAKKNTTPTVVASAEHTTIDVSDENQIPAFDESVITGIYRDIVDLAVRGTTIPPQFAFLNAKVYLGARMAGRTTFEGLDCDSSYYGAAIGITGTSKGESWRRTFEKILNPRGLIELKPNLKVIYSADSGAGLKDAFFEPPKELPIVCYIDEVATLGHKAGEKKNPEILDTIIELADGHCVSRVKAKHGKQASTKTHDNARLSLYACGQDGPAFMSAFAGRTKLGLFDRLYPEFSGPIEAGYLPEIKQADVTALQMKLSALNFNCKMTMSAETESKLNEFWKSQPGEIRRKIRFKKYVMLDMYMAAFGRGVTVAGPEDLDVAIKIFNRQMVIRQVCFTGEVPDRIGFYIGKIKAILEAQRRELNSGKTVAQVAKSIRDFQTLSNAFRDNELHTFERAWKSLSEHVTPVAVVAGNGQKYQKWVPMPYEHEMWVWETTAA